MFILLSIGTSKSGIKYKGEIDVPNLSDENDKEDLDVSNPSAQKHLHIFLHPDKHNVCIHVGCVVCKIFTLPS